MAKFKKFEPSLPSVQHNVDYFNQSPAVIPVSTYYLLWQILVAASVMSNRCWYENFFVTYCDAEKDSWGKLKHLHWDLQFQILCVYYNTHKQGVNSRYKTEMITE